MNYSKLIDMSKLPEPKDKWWNKFKWVKKFKDFLRDIKWEIYNRPLRRLQIIKSWLPIIWKDYDFDSCYIFEALIFKINQTANKLEADSMFVGWKQTVSKMRTVVRLLKKVKDEDYAIEYMEYFDTNFKFEDDKEVDKNGGKLYTLNMDILKDNSQYFFLKYPRGIERISKDKDFISEYNITTEKLEEIEALKDSGNSEDNKSLAFWIAAHNHHRAKKLVFKMIGRYIEDWWD